MLPLDVIAALLEKHGHQAWALQIRSLASREELRVGGFWEDLGAASIWSQDEGLASVRLADAEDGEKLRRAWFQVADEMILRGVGSPESDAWAQRFREEIGALT